MNKLNLSMPPIAHPSEKAVEEYLFGRHTEHDLEAFEIHLLACESCVLRLERLETDISAMKLALCDFSFHDSRKAQPKGLSLWNWFSLSPLAWATSAALLALCLSLPKIAQQHAATNELVLHADRGSAITVVPVHQSAILALDAVDLPSDTISAQVVNEYGSEVWNGGISIGNNKAQVVLPPLTNKGTYFLRLSRRASSSNADSSLLREFVFEVR